MSTQRTPDPAGSTRIAGLEESNRYLRHLADNLGEQCVALAAQHEIIACAECGSDFCSYEAREIETGIGGHSQDITYDRVCPICWMRSPDAERARTDAALARTDVKCAEIIESASFDDRLAALRTAGYEVTEGPARMRCRRCHLVFEVGTDETDESLARECGVGHHTDTAEGCPHA